MFVIFAVLILISVLNIIFGVTPSDTVIAPVILFVVLPIVFYVLINISATKSYRSNQRLQEEMAWEFTDKTATVTAASFSIIMDLDKCYKIQELKNWFLLYENNMICHFIPKTHLSVDNIQTLRGIFGSQTGVKKIILKKDRA